MIERETFVMPSSERQTRTSKGGFILLLTVLITSIILAISMSLYTITLKELELSSFLKNSASAFAAADKASECALYWDRAHIINGTPYTIFATSTDWTVGSIDWNSVTCDNGAGVNIKLNSVPTGWLSTPLSSTQGITTFHLNYAGGSCAEVIVDKDDIITTITVNGYNIDCSVIGKRATERTIVTTMNF